MEKIKSYSREKIDMIRDIGYGMYWKIRDHQDLAARAAFLAFVLSGVLVYSGGAGSAERIVNYVTDKTSEVLSLIGKTRK